MNIISFLKEKIECSLIAIRKISCNLRHYDSAYSSSQEERQISYIDIRNDKDILFFLFIFNLKFNAYFKTLIEFINEESHRYHDEMIDFLQDRFDIEVSLATISQTLKKHKLSWKKMILNIE